MGLAGHRSPAYISPKLPVWQLLVEMDLGVELCPCRGASGEFHSAPSGQEATAQLLGGTCSLALPVVLARRPLHTPTQWATGLGCGWTWLGCAWGECVLPNPTGDCHQGKAGCTQSTCCRSAVLDPSLWTPSPPPPPPNSGETRQRVGVQLLPPFRGNAVSWCTIVSPGTSSRSARGSAAAWKWHSTLWALRLAGQPFIKTNFMCKTETFYVRHLPFLRCSMYPPAEFPSRPVSRHFSLRRTPETPCSTIVLNINRVKHNVLF